MTFYESISAWYDFLFPVEPAAVVEALELQPMLLVAQRGQRGEALGQDAVEMDDLRH